jgi:hypothetical protein
MIPSGYKNAKVYSAVPTDGSGDLSFTRASNATRVASNGLIEKVRTNLLTYSNTFTDATWVKTSATITANDAVSPDGTTNASKYEGTNATNAATKTTTLANGLYTFSIFVKRIATDNFRMNFSDGSTGEIRYVFNLSNQTSTTTKSGGTISDFSTTYVAYPNGWYRLSIAARTNAGTTIISYFEADNEVGSFYVYGAQLEQGDVMTDYIATTTAAVSVGPVSGLPRLDYLNSSCPRLLLEPQRTNLVTFSEQIDNAAWTKSETTISANAATSPDGYTNADKLIASTNNAAHETKQSFTGLSGSYTISCFLKADGYNYAFIRSQVNTGADRYGVIIDLTNGTTYANATGSPTGTSSSVTSYGNGWYRLSVTATTNNSLGITIGPSSGTTFGGVSLPATFAGNGTNGVLVYGCMAEAGSYPSSYLPTLSTSVTRVADIASVSYTGLTTTSGSLFFDLKEGFAGQNINSGVASLGLRLSSTGTNDSVGVRDATLGTFQGVIRIGGSSTNLGNVFSGSAATKVCFVWTASTIKMFKDGALFASASISTPAVFNTLELPNSVRTVSAPLAQALIFPTALPDAQAIELTTI